MLYGIPKVIYNHKMAFTIHPGKEGEMTKFIMSDDGLNQSANT